MVIPHPPAVPVIDLAKLNAGEEGKKEVVAELLSALRNIGFFSVINHSVPLPLVDQLFKTDVETKRRIPYVEATNTGYLGHGQEKIWIAHVVYRRLNFKEKALDCKEAYNMPACPEAESLIPPELARNGIAKSFMESCHATLHQLLELLAVALDIPAEEGGETYLSSKHSFGGTPSILRLLHYPPVAGDSAESGSWTRAGGHTDYGSLTLLFQSGVGGLEALLRVDPTAEPVWVPVPPVAGAIVVNSGDLLEFWTRGAVKSTVHRVVVPQEVRGVSRYSLVYFAQPIGSTPLTPIPSPLLRELADAAASSAAVAGFSTAGDVAKSISASQHLWERLSHTQTY
ncbi:hypothetical protein BDK51DRAFT_35356 [Blyttiomyces helicus]|uniref:Fe2OG dioxygenase domain-containing protein n=1 Tax=Blyttiomyces helicus TaxID=388810 RepID=A0A4P9WRG6_9FUNG|nr:hypothetical protein BDK51DRAFT_35356 [Blyttiomyces helicus]|eukprot:RKO93506.1 hypothetical protein BDK51DRAFT_35356 [Blyttiomyces helicus]